MTSHPEECSRRILWLSSRCLLDESAEACSVLAMLQSLQLVGFEVLVLTAAKFKSRQAFERFKLEYEIGAEPRDGAMIGQASNLDFLVMRSETPECHQMSERDIDDWLILCRQIIRSFSPDVLFGFGTSSVDRWVADEAGSEGIAFVKFLFGRDERLNAAGVDASFVVTDNAWTADLYRRRHGFLPLIAGPFVDPRNVVATHHRRLRVLCFTPVDGHDAFLLVRLLLIFERVRPDIVFEVVDESGRWRAFLREVLVSRFDNRRMPGNVILTAAAKDMRPIYGRARLMLSMGRFNEGGSKRAVEAILNGIPGILSEHGECVGVFGGAGVALDMQAIAECTLDDVGAGSGRQPAVVTQISRFFDDEPCYRRYVNLAYDRSSRFKYGRVAEGVVDQLDSLISQNRRLHRNANMWSAEQSVSSVLLHSFVGGVTSLGRVGQQTFNHLITKGYDVHLKPFKTEQFADSWPDEVKSRVFDGAGQPVIDQQIKLCSVLEARQKRFGRYLTPWFFHDVDGLPKAIAEGINSNDSVYVISEFLRDIFVANGVTVRVDVLGLGVDPAHYYWVDRNVGEGVFRFLCIAEHTSRKNLLGLLSAFEAAFAADCSVELLVKTGVHDAEELQKVAAAMSSRVVIDSTLYRTNQEMFALYAKAHCFVLATHFEGFGLPYLEAMATGLPVIATHYSGHLDFCNRNNSYLIDVKRMIRADTRCFPGIPGWWAEPDRDHLISLMREVAQSPEQALERGKRASVSVASAWTWDAQLSKVFPGRG